MRQTTRGLRRAGTAGSADVGVNASRASYREFGKRHNQRLPARGRPAVGLPVVLLLVFFAVACGKSNDEVATFKVEPLQFTRRVTAEGTLKAVKATPVTAPHDAPQALKVSWIADDGALLKKDDVIVRFDSTDFENMLLRGNEDRTTASNKLNKAGAEAGATRTNLKRDAKQAQAELDAAKRFTFDDAEVFSRYDRIEAEVDQGLAGHKKRHAEEVLVVRDSLAQVERELLSIEDRKAGMKITQAEQGLRALQVVAPHDGILVLSRNWRGEMPRIGDMMWRGQPIGEIPELATMKAEVFVLEADAAGLTVGQKATLRLESQPDMVLTGKIKTVDKMARPRIPRQPVQYFGVTVEIDSPQARFMKPGTRVRAVLELENQTGAFAIPRQAVFEKEGKKLVYRRKGEGFEAVPIVIGSSSAGRVVVTKGLVSGDQIALEDPEKDGEGATDGKS